MKFEGEFKEGKIHGRGLITFSDGTHGIPRTEGFFDGNKLTSRENCGDVVESARQAAEMARKIVNRKLFLSKM